MSSQGYESHMGTASRTLRPLRVQQAFKETLIQAWRFTGAGICNVHGTCCTSNSVTPTRLGKRGGGATSILLRAAKWATVKEKWIHRAVELSWDSVLWTVSSGEQMCCLSGRAQKKSDRKIEDLLWNSSSKSHNYHNSVIQALFTNILHSISRLWTACIAIETYYSGKHFKSLSSKTRKSHHFSIKTPEWI